MLRGGIWRTRPRFHCASNRQARAYSSDSPKPRPFPVGGKNWGSSWGSASDNFARPSPPDARSPGGLLPHERAARDEAARRKAAADANGAGPRGAPQEPARRPFQSPRIAPARQAAPAPPLNRGPPGPRQHDRSPVSRVPFPPPGRDAPRDQPRSKPAEPELVGTEWGQLRRRDPTQLYPGWAPWINTRDSRPIKDWSAKQAVRVDSGDQPVSKKDAPKKDAPETWDDPLPTSGGETLVADVADPAGPADVEQSSTARPDNVLERRRDGPERPKKQRGRRQRHDDDGRYHLDEDVVEERRRRKAERKKEQRERELARAAEKAGPRPILLPQFISVSNLAVALGAKQDAFLRQLGELGFESIGPESIMTGETAALVAGEFGFEPTVDAGEGVDLKPREPAKEAATLPPRPPVVTIMGHVDHGKTTLLDYLRKTSVAAQEHGGITQHIGAFSVRLPSSGRQITFLDTPGHAAFLAMRQRGANVTDMVVLVVAADDSVKPQTVEALRHARAARVPIVVAINKVDKEGARIDLVKSDLARSGVEIEDFGGDVQVVCVSGKTGEGMGQLEESVATLAEILDLRAETDGLAEGWVLESTVRPLGRVATVLVKRGTLRAGDCVVAGSVWARVRGLRNEAGVDVAEAGPGTAVEVLGWKEAPAAGDQVLQAPDEGRAKDAVRYRAEHGERERAVAEMVGEKRRREGAEKEEAEKEAGNEGGEEAAAGPTIVNLVVKGDVHGSVESVCAAVAELGNHEVRARVLRSAAGQVSEWDVEHAATSGSLVVNFNNPIPGHVKRLADVAGVRVLDHSIIYHLVDDVKAALSAHLAPVLSTRVLGEAEVLQVFAINLRGRVYKNIAGCRVRNGQVSRNAKYRVLRGGLSIFEGPLDSLKHGKKDVAEMRKGTECGLSFVGWDDLQAGDLIQAYEEISSPRHL